MRGSPFDHPDAIPNYRPKLTVGCFFTYVAPFIWGLVVGLLLGPISDTNHFPLWVWKTGCLMVMPFGIWRSKPGWRRGLGTLFLLLFVFWIPDVGLKFDGLPMAILLVGWYLAFQAVYWEDGKELHRLRQRPAWER